ncbi:unnamed protein product, partial [Haemonchus placei]|uniref:Ovule protein n=1 Tax=Haemonchus placei TaxID=6290 RepID=A0A0N4VSA7_HAEPC
PRAPKEFSKEALIFDPSLLRLLHCVANLSPFLLLSFDHTLSVVSNHFFPCCKTF